MAQKLLHYLNGEITQLEARDQSVGVGDAGKVIALDSTGKIHPSMLPAGLTLELGTSEHPFRSLNVRKVDVGNYHLIGANFESVVTRTQTVEGVLVIDGVNTILGSDTAPPDNDCGDCFVDALIFG